MMGKEEFAFNRLVYYAIPHYLFLMIYVGVLCKYQNSASFNHRTGLPCSYKAKVIMNVFCAVLCIFFTVYEFFYDITGSLIQLLYAVAWLCSTHLLTFSYDRALPLTWPHRLYWVLDFLITLVVFVLELVGERDSVSLISKPVYVSMMGVSLALLSVLSLLALFYPKDFHQPTMSLGRGGS